MVKNVVLLVMMLALTGIATSTAMETKAFPRQNTEDTSESELPERIEIIVATEAVGDTDFNARVLANKLSQKLGTTFVVSNVPGEGGVAASRMVHDAKSDGSKVLFYHSAFAVNQLSGLSDYDLNDYAFAGIAGMNPGNALVVNAGLGINSLEELFAYTKENPGQLRMAVEMGATSYAVALLLKSVGLDVEIVDVGGGSDERLASLLTGRTDVTLAPYGVIEEYVEADIVVPLALDGLGDLEEVNLRSIEHLGYDIGFPFYYFFAFPKGTDQALVQEFTNALKEIIEEDTHYAEIIYNATYQRPVYFDPEEGLEKFEQVYERLGKADFPRVSD